MHASFTRRSVLVAGVLLAAPRGAVPLGAQVSPPPPAYAISSWTTREGMPQSAVNALALDDEGYLWLGTNVGLARFDGDSFVAYPRNGGRTRFEPVNWLVHDGGGRLWILLPESGLARLEPQGRIARVPVTLLSEFSDLAVQGMDTVWLGRIRGVRRLDGSAWREEQGLPDGIVGDLRTLRLDGDGGLWVGGTRGLVRYAKGARRAERIALACDEVGDVSPTRVDGAWVTTCAGLEHVVPGQRRATLVSREPHGTAQVLALPSEGVVWTAGRDGVRRFRTLRDAHGTWRVSLQFHHSLDLAGALPSVMIDDHAAGVFIGTNGAGLRHVRRLAGRRVTIADGLPDRPVHHLAPDGTGGLWIGNCYGLSRWRDGRLAVMRSPAMGMLGPCVNGLLHDSTGALWIGQLNGLVRVDRAGRSRVVFRPQTVPAEEVAPLMEDRDGRVWFATSGGTTGYVPSPDAPPILLSDSVLPAERTWSMVQAPSGAIWIGQRGRLTRLERGVVTRQLTTADGVPDAPLRGLLIDPDGAIWMATYGGGLARFDSAQGVRRLRPAGRAFEQMLSAIRLDREDRLWILGDGGVTAMPRAAARQATADGTPLAGIVLGALEGVPEGNGGFANAWLDPMAQRLWLATVDGVASVDVTEAPPGRRPLPVHVDDILIDDVSYGAPDTLRVPAAAGAIDVHFSAPLFGLDRAARLRYRLRGHDRQWIDAGGARVARYAEVTPGRYDFEVVLERAPGDAQPSVARLPVLVAAHWWETSAARLAQFLAAVALVWIMVRWRTESIRARNRALQREIAERERAERLAADAARELSHVSRIATAGELATSLAHELNQPLAAVMGSAQQARHFAERGDGEHLRQMLDAIEDQSERAAEVIRALRAFVLKQPAWSDDVSLRAVVADTIRLLRQELQGRGAAVAVDDRRAADAPVQGDAIQLQQVLVNLLLNAADAVADAPPDRRRLAVRLQDEPPGRVRVSVSDSGPDVPEEVFVRLFEPFFSTKSDGLGLGLSLSRSIVEAHGGRLWAERAAEGGSVFQLELPLAGR
jgi:signal transduction histidine kinase/ligand-binding sensor domain-containing protein